MTRYSDFIVNEITPDGQVVKPPKRDPKAVKVEEVKPNEPEKIELTQEQEEVFKRTLNGNDFTKFLKFIDEINLYASCLYLTNAKPVQTMVKDYLLIWTLLKEKKLEKIFMRL